MKEDALAEWRRFFADKKFFGIDADFTGIIVPEPHIRAPQAIIVPKGLEYGLMWELCVKRFNARTSYELTKAIDLEKEERRPEKNGYAVRCGSHREAQDGDTDLAEMTGFEIKKHGVKTMTLRERLLLELFHDWKKAGRLDEHDTTLCTGSQYRGRLFPFPSVYWINGRLYVGWGAWKDTRTFLKARRVMEAA